MLSFDVTGNVGFRGLISATSSRWLKESTIFVQVTVTLKTNEARLRANIKNYAPAGAASFGAYR
jgi:hypothetical protein